MGNKTPITCFTVDENKKAEIHQVTIDALLGSTHFKWRYINPFLFFKIQKKCKQAGIKHIIIEHPYMGWLGILLKKFAGVTLIIRSHNIEGLRFKSIHKWWWKILFVYEKLVHKMADLSLFITQEDFDYAVTHYKTSASKSMVATYGIEEAEPTPFSEKIKAKENICIKYGLDNHTKIFLFNGSLNYKPNTDAVQEIIEKINPLLLNQKLHYKVIICGKGLPDSLKILISDMNPADFKALATDSQSFVCITSTNGFLTIAAFFIELIMFDITSKLIFILSLPACLHYTGYFTFM